MSDQTHPDTALSRATPRKAEAARSEPLWLAGLLRLGQRLNLAAAILSAALLVAMTGLILLEIILRLFSHSTYMSDTLVSYGVAAITFLAAPWALEQGAMIRVSVLTGRLGARLRWLCEAFALSATGGLLGFLALYQWKSVTKLFARGSVSENIIPIPLWIPEAVFLLGLGLLLLQILLRALRLVFAGHDDEHTLTL